MRRNLLFFAGVLLATSGLFAQDEFKMGNWRAHFPYHQLKFIAYDPPLVWGASFSGLFSYHTEDYAVERYNVLNGLSDVGISALRMHRGKKALIIGYENGNIDIMRDGRVINVSDIMRADILGSKTIKNIKISGDTVYIVTPFGISLLYLTNYAILSTYRFGSSQTSIEVNDMALLGDSLFVATSRGIYCAPREGLNLLDFGNWKRLRQLPLISINYDFCEAWADTLWIGRKIHGWQNDEVYLYRKGNYRRFQFPSFGCDIRRINADNGYLNLVANNEVYWFTANGQRVHRQPYFGQNLGGATDMFAIDEWNYYLADPAVGLMRKVKFQTHTDTITPNGPAFYQSFHVNVTDDEVWVSGGSYGQPWNHYGIYRFKNNFWTNYNRQTTDSLSNISNISISITNPWNPKHVIGGSFGYGLVEFLDGEIVKTWNIFNSPLEPVSGLGDGYNRITGLAYDRKQNLWISQWGAENPLVVKKNNGEWQVFNLDNQITKKYSGEMVSTPWGDIWMLLDGHGIAVFNAEKLLNGQPNAYKVFEIKRSDGTTHKEVRTIALDNDETMWIGMRSGGIFVYYNPRSALTSNMIASQLLVEVDDRVEYLLGKESITDIKVDGGNRKWIATYGGGVFLVNEGGNKQILNLTAENSPLISNAVLSVDINRKSGEVFFATELGVVSYVGSATEGKKELAEIDVYPSPVHKNYEGSVIIRGLMENTTIKITDLTGKLVYETYSNGGTGIWNVRDFDGSRVPSGVYLIFCASEDGTFTANAKIFVAGQ
jgi:hypothetical protein